MQNFKDIVRRTDSIMKTISNRWLKDAWKNEEKISRVLSILSDDYSRDTYAKEILWCFLNTFLKGQLASAMSGMMRLEQWQKHLTNMYAKSVHMEMEASKDGQAALDISKTTTFLLEQYRYKEKVCITSGDICLDLGACYGDTAIWMMENGATSVHSFEIDPANISAMQKNIFKNHFTENIHIVQNAVGAKNETLYVIPNSYNPAASHIVSQKPPSGIYHEIECVSLDTFCRERNIKPTFIKMDIEGAEYDAIEGCKEIFTKERPKFAICIYHTTEHRWQIPLYLAELCPDYNFYVKKSHPVFETVFFGCPK